MKEYWETYDLEIMNRSKFLPMAPKYELLLGRLLTRHSFLPQGSCLDALIISVGQSEQSESFDKSSESFW